MIKTNIKVKFFSKIPGLPDTSNITDPQTRLFLDQVKSALEAMANATIDTSAVGKALMADKDFSQSLKDVSKSVAEKAADNAVSEGKSDTTELYQEETEKKLKPVSFAAKEVSYLFAAIKSDDTVPHIMADRITDFSESATVNVYENCYNGNTHPDDLTAGEKLAYSTGNVAISTASTIKASAALKIKLVGEQGNLLPYIDNLVALPTGNSKTLKRTVLNDSTDDYTVEDIECIEVTDQLGRQTGWIIKDKWDSGNLVKNIKSDISQGKSTFDDDPSLDVSPTYYIKEGDNLNVSCGTHNTDAGFWSDPRFVMYGDTLYYYDDPSDYNFAGYVFEPNGYVVED